VFAQIHPLVVFHDSYFKEKVNKLEQTNLSLIQKNTIILHMFVYWVAVDNVD
jgi:hypothetical protein